MYIVNNFIDIEFFLVFTLTNRLMMINVTAIVTIFAKLKI
jgi:hypothetical protein